MIRCPDLHIRRGADPDRIQEEDHVGAAATLHPAIAARTVGRQIIQQRRTLQQQQRNQLRPGQVPGREQRPGLQQQRPELRTVPGGQPLPSPGTRPTLQQQPGAPPTQQQPGPRPNLQQQPGTVPPGGRPSTPTLPQQPGTRPTLPQQPGAAPPGGRPNAPTLQQQPGARPTLQRQPGAPSAPQRAPAGQRKPAKKNEPR